MKARLRWRSAAKTATLSLMFELVRTLVLAALGVALALLSAFGVTAEHAAAPSEPVPARIEAEPATSTPPVSPQVTASTTEGNVAVKPKPAVPKPATPPEVPKIDKVIETVTTPPPIAAPSTLNEKVRAAVVNILCVTESGGPFNSISASGVMIDPHGVILTNAHVAQYFLLKDYPAPGFVDCYVRTGSPAQPKYKAELLFLPPSWIQKNAHKIDDDIPTGNGEHDYALVRITGAIKAADELPASFPYLAWTAEPPVQSQSTLIAGYPAGFLGGITIAKELYQASSVTAIRELYTFGTNTPDLFSIGGSIVAQQGSSGGAVATESGALLGLIVTSTNAPDTASRDLRALAMHYIERDFSNESGKPLDLFLAGELDAAAHAFNTGTAPTLTQTLINVLEGK